MEMLGYGSQVQATDSTMATIPLKGWSMADGFKKTVINMTRQEKLITLCMGVAIITALSVQIMYVFITFIH
jgi:hypothetical protein